MPDRKTGDASRAASTEMKMTPDKPDLSDITYDAFLMNGRSPADPWIGTAKAGDMIRLRVVNGGASTLFRFAVDGHTLTVTHADGEPVQPVEADWLLIGMGECYDILVRIAASGSYIVRAEAQDGSGQAIGILRTPDASGESGALTKPRWEGRQLTYSQLRRLPAAMVWLRTPHPTPCRWAAIWPTMFGRSAARCGRTPEPLDHRSRRPHPRRAAERNAHVASDAPARTFLPPARRRGRSGPRTIEAYGSASPWRDGCGSSSSPIIPAAGSFTATTFTTCSPAWRASGFTRCRPHRRERARLLAPISHPVPGESGFEGVRGWWRRFWNGAAGRGEAASRYGSMPKAVAT